MANPEHVKIVSAGTDAIAAARRTEPMLRLDLTNAPLDHVSIRKADLRNSDLKRVVLRYADLRETDLRGVDLRGATLTRIDLRRAQLFGAELTSARLIHAKLTLANLRRAIMDHADFENATLREAQLQESTLTEARLNNADLRYADLGGAYLQGARLKKAMLSGASLIRADLTDADLTDADLTDADLTNADLTNADLKNADLTNAKLQGATLNNAILTGVCFQRADLTETDFMGADLCRADLRMADLADTFLTDVTLSKSIWGHSRICNTCFEGVTTLTEAKHFGPSSLGLDTIERNAGNLPDAFLRGCGVPEAWIDYIPSLIGSAFQFYSCFISYNHDDKQFARQLHDRLQGQGIRCWLDEHAMVPGDDIYRKVDEGIRIWDKVLLCCSESSLKSPWVEREIDTAIEREMEFQKSKGEQILKIIPLNLDGSLFDWTGSHAATLRKRLAADFTGWKSDADKFEQQFEFVVKALRTDRGQLPPPKPILGT